MNLFIPVILIGISIGAFFTFIDPEYKKVQVLNASKQEFVEQEQQSEKIQKKKAVLTKEFSENIASEDIARLEKLLPNHMDNVELIVDIDRIAKEEAIRIGDISLVKNGDSRKKEKSTSIDIVENKEYESVNLSFSFVTKYDNFKRFIENLRKSLRLLDIVSVNFSRQGDREGKVVDNFTFDIVVRTY